MSYLQRKCKECGATQPMFIGKSEFPSENTGSHTFECYHECTNEEMDTEVAQVLRPDGTGWEWDIDNNKIIEVNHDK